ncbi:TadE/TadG family type IV pilus assembly protein [uncultured Brevundimonas sp.]|uniref:TadE/TadG family type IV pilus assembly protein n=1 Tax=uncultured Brevundimonas sp. TaxID=213418 RepID=UPI0025FDD196|nr:TadE/TadG family type IV pilus assembly protein [uncultured Brevundimonas sp.]
MSVRFSDWRGFRRDERGLAAVEFALLAPVMILLYFGMAELCQAHMAHKRMTHVTSMVADMTARTQSVTRADLNSIFNIGNQIMQPFPSGPLQTRVSSVTRDNTGVVRVNWSFGRGMTPRTGTVVVPDGLINNGESLIMTESIYDYSSPVDKFLPEITKLRRTYYLRPRITNQVTCSDC